MIGWLACLYRRHYLYRRSLCFDRSSTGSNPSRSNIVTDQTPMHSLGLHVLRQSSNERTASQPSVPQPWHIFQSKSSGTNTTNVLVTILIWTMWIFSVQQTISTDLIHTSFRLSMLTMSFSFIEFLHSSLGSRTRGKPQFAVSLKSTSRR